MVGSSLNFSSTTPTAPSGNLNVRFQTDGNGDVSGYVPDNSVVLSGLSTSVNNLNTEVSSISTSVGSLSTSTSTGISTNASNIGSLSTSTSTGLSSLSSGLSSTNSNLTSLSTSTSSGLSSLSTGLSSTNSNLASLSTSTSAGISTNASNIGSLSTSTSTGLSSLSTGLSSTNSNLASLSTSTSSGISTIEVLNNAGFVDGNFDSWQVGTSFTLAAATDTYTADMWVCNAGTGGAATVTQQTATLGAEPSYMARPRKYQLSYAQTTAATSSPTIGQKLEGVSQYNGQTITVSASLAAAAAGTDVVGIQVTQNFGTGGSPSASVVTTQAVSWALGTTEQKFSAQIAVPSISGKMLGTGGNDYVRVDLLLATGGTYTVYASQMQIDVGTVALPFRYRGLGAELVRIFRYVQLLTGFLPMGAFFSATAAFTGVTFSQMRATPACTANAAFVGTVQVPNSTVQTATTKACIGETSGSVLVELGGVSGTANGTAALYISAGGFILDSRL